MRRFKIRKKIMKKIIAALAGMLILGAGITCFAVDSGSVQSFGALVYGGNYGSVGIYSSDIELLAEEADAQPDTVYNPDDYAHTHTWTLKTSNTGSHTFICSGCGETKTEEHAVKYSELTTFTYSGAVYEGILYTCDCGYSWITEYKHNLIYTDNSDGTHTAACALEGTKYCQGFEDYTEGHIYSDAYPDEWGELCVHNCLMCGNQVVDE